MEQSDPSSWYSWIPGSGTYLSSWLDAAQVVPPPHVPAMTAMPASEPTTQPGIENISGDDDHDDDNGVHDFEAMAVYCKECQTWLNGPRQWEDHKIGKKHRKNVLKARRAARLAAANAANDEDAAVEPEPNELVRRCKECSILLEVDRDSM